MPLHGKVPEDYEERVYAGVLGKIIGVYLGRPFEGWTNERIERELGEVWYYVHEKLNQPLIVSDDDISGTFTFLRALNDHGISANLSAEAVGKTWLNYLIENRTVLWWGGIGMSTEHTAYYRLKSGIPAPLSGSMDLNGQVVAEQIGSQIFIDGWAMVCPGDPEAAVVLAGRAASVSHDGEAIYGAQVIAAMEALAFVESRIPVLLRAAQTYIPPGSIIYHLINDLFDWHAENPRNWRWAFRKIEEKYGYDTYGGNCHMIPNHAIIILALLYGEDDFQKTLMIANTAGWDTDCNAANVGCLMGIKNGLAHINKRVDFRGPVADRMYLPTADGGRCITDAAIEAYRIVNLGRALHGQRPLFPNNGARFHFNLPGTIHGFECESSPECNGTIQLTNDVVPRTGDNGEALDERALTIHYSGIGPGRPGRVATATFLPPEAMKSSGYGMECCPTLYSGQTIRARVVAHEDNPVPAPVMLYVSVYGDKDKLETVAVAQQIFVPGTAHHFHATVPDTGGKPIASIGLEIQGDAGSGILYLDWLSWDGMPSVTFCKPEGVTSGSAWRKAWVNAASEFVEWGLWEGNQFKLIQNKAEDGFVFTGCREWSHYTVSTNLYPHLADRVGLIACGRGLRRYVALTLSNDNVARLIERYDDEETVLAESTIGWSLDHSYQATLTTMRDGTLNASLLRDEPTAEPILLSAYIAAERATGNIGLLVAAGHAQFGAVQVVPAE